MAKVTLVNGKSIEINEKQAAAVVAARKMFADEGELNAFLSRHQDLTDGTGRTWHMIQASVRQRMAASA